MNLIRQHKFVFLFFVFLVVLFYFPSLFQHKTPFPGDLLVGAYFPWLDYKWGNIVGVAVKNPVLSDVFSQIYLWKIQVIEQFRLGQWPLWNPYQFAGYPLLANFQSSPFNPFGLLQLIFGITQGWKYMSIVQHLLAAISMYLLLIKTQTKNKSSALVGATMYAFSSFAFAWNQFQTAGFAFAIFPLLCLSIITNSPVLAIITSAFLATTGHLQSIIYIVLTALAFSKNLKSLLRSSLLIVLGLLIASPSWILSFDYSGDTVRFTESFSSASNYGLVPLGQIITTFAPDFFGHPATRNEWGSQNYLESIMSLGVFGFISSLWLVFYSKEKRLKLLLLIPLFYCIDSPLSQYFALHGPSSLTTGFATRIMLIAIFIACLAVTKFIDHGSNKLKIKINLYLVVTIVFMLVVIIYLQKYFQLSRYDLSIWAGHMLVARNNLLLPLALALGFLFLHLLPIPAKLKTGLILVLAVFESFRFGQKYIPQTSQAYLYPTTPVLDFLIKNAPASTTRIAVENGPLLTPNTWSYYKLASISGYDPMAPKDYVEYYSHTFNDSSSSSRYSELNRYDALSLGENNVKYLLALNYDDKDGIANRDTKTTKLNYKINQKDWSKVFSDGAVNVLENKFFQPRVFLLGSKDLVDIKSYTPNQVIIQTSNSSSQDLIFLDRWDKNWKATVNGNQVPIQKYKNVYRKVSLSGPSTVIFTYRPELFYWSLKISLFLILSIALFKLATIKSWARARQIFSTKNTTS